jgi:hypothetical protein
MTEPAPIPVREHEQSKNEAEAIGELPMSDRSVLC